MVNGIQTISIATIMLFMLFGVTELGNLLDDGAISSGEYWIVGIVAGIVSTLIVAVILHTMKEVK